MILPVTASALEEELKRIGVHPGSLPIFRARSAIKPLKLYNVRTPAANIMKQELLGAGADCAIHRDCVSGRTENTDMLLLGTLKEYREVLRKIAPMPFFGLPEIADELKACIERPRPGTRLADGRPLDYSRVLIMGIVNVTGDSFYAASRARSAAEAAAAAGRMLEEGADIIDVGAESTRPGSLPASPEEELERLVSAIRAIKKDFPHSVVSADTYRVAAARAAIDEGADIVNDITGAASPEMILLVAGRGVPIIITHMRGVPKTMQDSPAYNDVVREVCEFLDGRGAALKQAGAGREKIIVDPGIGFGKTTANNLELLRRLGEFTGLGYPVLLAASRKTVIGETLGALLPEERLEGTIALSCQAVVAGANIVRVHDVKENAKAIRMLEAVR
ncbi:MAG: dihydropteroate synthase [Acidaminococcales bacterium]|nr:dihydropteroate synthase [Acidaminococcales bacterium]